MVSLSRWKFLFAAVAKLGSSSNSSAAHRSASISSCTAAWTTSRSALRASAAYTRAGPFFCTAARTTSWSALSAS
eukprot:863839-Amphidinium_carterae.1